MKAMAAKPAPTMPAFESFAPGTAAPVKGEGEAETVEVPDADADADADAELEAALGMTGIDEDGTAMVEE